MVKHLIVAILVAVVILTECLLAYLLIPSRSDLEAWAKAQASQGHAASDAGHGDAHAQDQGHGGHGSHGEQGKSGHDGHEGDKEIEVDLGKYNIMVHQPTANMTLRINFHLIGTVREEDHHEFEELFGKHQHRLRDLAIFEVRSSQMEDLTDPGLGLLKRRILAKSNELFGKPLLRSVVFSDFSFLEQ